MSNIIITNSSREGNNLFLDFTYLSYTNLHAEYVNYFEQFGQISIDLCIASNEVFPEYRITKNFKTSNFNEILLLEELEWDVKRLVLENVKKPLEETEVNFEAPLEAPLERPLNEGEEL